MTAKYNKNKREMIVFLCYHTTIDVFPNGSKKQQIP